MMLYPAMKDLLEKVPSRYELVNVVACKARRIARDAEMAGEPLAEKPVSIAIQAVARGRAGGQDGADAGVSADPCLQISAKQGAAPLFCGGR